MAEFFSRLGLRHSDILLFAQAHQPGQPTALENYTYRALDQVDFERDPIFAIKNRRPTFIARLRAGHLCHGHINAEGGVASYQWVSDGPAVAPFEAGLYLKVPTARRYIWDCRTIDGARGRGLYRHALQMLAAETAAEKWIVCAADNEASARGIRNADYRRTGQLHLYRIGPLGLLRDDASVSMWRATTPLSFRTWGRGTHD